MLGGFLELSPRLSREPSGGVVSTSAIGYLTSERVLGGAPDPDESQGQESVLAPVCLPLSSVGRRTP